eukprot:COSAG05_NODE_11499_length_510_cov_1.364964_1_plen_67_part_10
MVAFWLMLQLLALWTGHDFVLAVISLQNQADAVISTEIALQANASADTSTTTSDGIIAESGDVDVRT